MSDNSVNFDQENLDSVKPKFKFEEDLKTEPLKTDPLKEDNQVKLDSSQNKEIESKDKAVDQKWLRQIDGLKQEVDNYKLSEHSNRKKLSYLKNKLATKLNSFVEDGFLSEEEKLSLERDIDLDNIDISATQTDEKSIDSKKERYRKASASIHRELENYKKYNKTNKFADEYFDSFFTYYPLLSKKEKEKVDVYLFDSKPEDSLDYILVQGKEFYDNIGEGVKEHKSLTNYVKSLRKNLTESQIELKKLRGEMDDVVHSAGNSVKQQKSLRKKPPFNFNNSSL